MTVSQKYVLSEPIMKKDSMGSTYTPPPCSANFYDFIDALNGYGDAEREFGAKERPINEEDREKVRLAKMRVFCVVDLISRSEAKAYPSGSAPRSSILL